MIKERVLPMTPEKVDLLRKFAEKATGWEIKDTRIKKIKVQSFSNRVRRPIASDICIGEELDLNLSNMPHESVLAIFESKEYIVVTPDKNELNGTVYFFRPQEVVSVEREK